MNWIEMLTFTVVVSEELSDYGLTVDDKMCGTIANPTSLYRDMKIDVRIIKEEKFLVSQKC